MTTFMRAFFLLGLCVHPVISGKLRSGLNREEASTLRLAVKVAAAAAESAEDLGTSQQSEATSVKLNDTAKAATVLTSTQNATTQDSIERVLPDDILENAPGSHGSDAWNGMVLGFVMIRDTKGQWNANEAFVDKSQKNVTVGDDALEAASLAQESAEREDTSQMSWMQQLFMLNRNKARKHGYRLVVRRGTTLGEDGLIPAQWDGCKADKVPERRSKQWCSEFYRRQNHNWEKEAMLSDYLSKPDVKHVLVMDGDAVMVHQRHDTMQVMADELERTGRDILIADEDWSVNGKGKMNGGLVFAKNTAFSRKFFADIVQSHTLGAAYKGPGPQCKNNEQCCFAAALGSYPGLKDKLLIASGSRWNRHPCLWQHRANGDSACSNGGAPKDAKVFDAGLEVVHFMGGAKGGVKSTLHNLGLIK